MWALSNSTVTIKVKMAKPGVQRHFLKIPMKTAIQRTNIESITGSR